METYKMQEFYVGILSSFYASLVIDKIPGDIIHKARLSLYDFIAVLITGKNYGVLSPLIELYIKEKRGKEEATVLGLNLKTSAELAAFALGTISHSVELDDGHRFGTAHPSVVIIPASLSLVEKLNVSFGELIKSIIIGYDCMLRVARAVNPSHLHRGFHSTGTCGTLGAAAAAAALYGFDKEKMAYAISMGGLQSAGLQEMLYSYPSIKPLQPGKAAEAGVLSAELVNIGAKSPLSIFEGFHGWIKAMADLFDKDALLGSLGSRWEIGYTYTKLYPTCRHCHPAIDLGIQLYQKGILIENIKNINLYMYDIGISEVGKIIHPVDFEQTMFSVAYSLAIALKFGVVRIQELKKSLNDDVILLFAKKINIISDSVMNKAYPEERGARIELVTINGENVVLATKIPKGEYDNPLTDEEYYNKSLIILDGIIPKNILSDLWDIIVLKDINNVKIVNIFSLLNKFCVN
jgi:2-methylcitrate dehydratase PrpD